MASSPSRVVHVFALNGPVIEIQNWVIGHINDTYMVHTGQNGHSARYVMQRINNHVFRQPLEVMENIVRVTAFLRRKVQERHGDPDRETLTLIPTRDGAAYHVTPEGEFWRAYKFIEGTRTFEHPQNLEHLTQAARAVGRFLHLLDDFPANQLHITIPGFHHTPKRFAAFIQALDADVHNRASAARDAIAFALARADDASLITDALATGELPLRVTHNDTKLNNVLIDEVTGEGVCMVDLDTVMPGSSLFDFGDLVRSAANTGAEDEQNLDRVSLDLARFKAIVRGYLAETKETLTAQERAWLPLGARIITYELGLRFLTDYLNGDVYFRIHRPDHNLDRARAQFKLVEDMEMKAGEMERIVAKV